MANRVTRLLRFWFTLDGAVDRWAYLASGVALMIVKYLGDAFLVWRASGIHWEPEDYLLHVHSLLTLALPGAPSWLLPVLALWALPFIWIGVSLTLRRGIDAGLSPWLTVAFFIPFVNFLLMLVLVIAPSSPSAKKQGATNRALPAGRRLPTAAIAIGAALLLAVAVFGFSTLLVKQYVAATIFGTPFAMGAIAGFLFNRKYPDDPMDTIKLSAFLFLFTAGAFLLFAYDGAVCIFMAFPIAFTVGLLGAFFGRAIALCGRRAMPPAISAMLILPACIALEPPHTTGRILHEVRSSVEINASPERVWEHVIAFPPITAPPDWISRLGVAYPEYAHIEGSGVGAVRYCVFSTGPFLEPITAWEPARQLAFDATSSPDPMRELSPYKNLSPPHLHGYLRSRRGEFRLVELPGRRTRLEGSTWYEIEMSPEGYWQLWSDFLIHRIHTRVLEHIKADTEAAALVQGTTADLVLR
jgi:uncharacterized membrane protein YhaH (DUF805 family)